MAPNRPRSRQRNISGAGKSIHRRGSGLGTGPVGRTGRSGSLGSSGSSGGFGRSGSFRVSVGHGSTGILSKIPAIIIILLFLLISDSGLSTILGMLWTNSYQGIPQGNQSYQEHYPENALDLILNNLGGGSISTGWADVGHSGDLDVSVAPGARDKYTRIQGGGRDTVTVLVYLCGTDLESRSKMATMDLQEMLYADLSDQVNLLVYTGGCSRWQNTRVSSQTNQIWQIRDGNFICLEENAGNRSMTDPDTLAEFIRWGSARYPADRTMLILWDHGGGSVSGFGYDEKFASSGSMDLAEIDRALTAGGIKFDFVGFDACLMATTETALMLSRHADYLIASEETEPGIGWYYTDWLSQLSRNTSLPTVTIGKTIIDDFVDTCNQKCSGQSTTLSLIDLAEAEHTIPDALTAFFADTCDLIRQDSYAQVSNARSGSREFGSSSRIDQVDLVHLAKNMGTAEGNALADALLGAVKYNRTSSNMANAYGLSIYFPFRKVSMVDNAVDTYEQLGMDEEYLRCIQAFAGMEVSGQAAAGGTGSPLPVLLDMMGTTSGGNAEMIQELLGTFLNGDVGNIAGLVEDNIGFLSGMVMDKDQAARYITDNSFDASALVWRSGRISLPEEQWELVQTLHANMFYDDGSGFIDLGMDTLYDFDEQGNLLAPTQITWIAINRQPVAYYHEYTLDDGTNYSILGRVPVLYNGERAELILEFTQDDPTGSVVGVRRVYTDGETQTLPKAMETVKNGDVIDFICDYYSYDGKYLDSYMLGEQLIVEGELRISDVYVDEDAARLTYCFTDIYNREYWTQPVS